MTQATTDMTAEEFFALVYDLLASLGLLLLFTWLVDMFVKLAELWLKVKELMKLMWMQSTMNIPLASLTMDVNGIGARLDLTGACLDSIGARLDGTGARLDAVEAWARTVGSQFTASRFEEGQAALASRVDILSRDLSALQAETHRVLKLKKDLESLLNSDESQNRVGADDLRKLAARNQRERIAWKKK